jgi:hypothetical protein
MTSDKLRYASSLSRSIHAPRLHQLDGYVPAGERQTLCRAGSPLSRPDGGSWIRGSSSSDLPAGAHYIHHRYAVFCLHGCGISLQSPGGRVCPQHARSVKRVYPSRSKVHYSPTPHQKSVALVETPPRNT